MSEVRDQTKGQPSYLRLLDQGQLPGRVEALESLLERCTVCPRDCLNNRLKDEIAACYSGRLPIVSSYTAHFGEEPALVGTRGAEISSLATAICVASTAKIIRSRKRTKSKSRMSFLTKRWPK